MTIEERQVLDVNVSLSIISFIFINYTKFCKCFKLLVQLEVFGLLELLFLTREELRSALIMTGELSVMTPGM